MKLNDHDQSYTVWFMMKTRKDNNVSDSTSTIYAKIKIDLSWSIEHDVIYHQK